MRELTVAAVSISLLIWLAASPNSLLAAKKDQSRIGEEPQKPPSTNSPFNPHFVPDKPEPETTPKQAPEPDLPDDPDQVVPFDILEPEDIPIIKTIELTIDIAKRAVDALAEVRDKYNEQGIDEYETLEEFVTATEAGKRLEADVRKFGFQDISDWNTSIASVGFALGALHDGEEAEILQQIANIKENPDIDAVARAKMVSSLEAMIASENNKSIVRQLMQDEYYAARLKLLEETE
ncbi:MAG: hypothetical protein ACR2OM_09740 [Aestuariivirgaceae bacterium]